jgi:hypothetical protein
MLVEYEAANVSPDATVFAPPVKAPADHSVPCASSFVASAALPNRMKQPSECLAQTRSGGRRSDRPSSTTKGNNDHERPGLFGLLLVAG